MPQSADRLTPSFFGSSRRLRFFCFGGAAPRCRPPGGGFHSRGIPHMRDGGIAGSGLDLVERDGGNLAEGVLRYIYG